MQDRPTDNTKLSIANKRKNHEVKNEDEITKKTRSKPKKNKLQILSTELARLEPILKKAIELDEVDKFKSIFAEAETYFNDFSKSKIKRPWCLFLCGTDIQEGALPFTSNSVIYFLINSGKLQHLQSIINFTATLLSKTNERALPIRIAQELYDSAFRSSLSIDKLKELDNIINVSHFTSISAHLLVYLIETALKDQNLDKFSVVFANKGREIQALGGLSMSHYSYDSLNMKPYINQLAKIVLQPENDFEKQFRKLLIHTHYSYRGWIGKPGLASTIVTSYLENYFASSNNDMEKLNFYTQNILPSLQKVGSELGRINNDQKSNSDFSLRHRNQEVGLNFEKIIIFLYSCSLPALKATLEFLNQQPNIENYIPVKDSNYLCNTFSLYGNLCQFLKSPELIKPTLDLFRKIEKYDHNSTRCFDSEMLFQESYNQILTPEQKRLFSSGQIRLLGNTQAEEKTICDYSKLIPSGDFYTLVAQIVKINPSYNPIKEFFLEHSEITRKKYQEAVDRLSLFENQLTQRNQRQNQDRVPTLNIPTLGADNQNTHASAIHRTISIAAKNLSIHYAVNPEESKQIIAEIFNEIKYYFMQDALAEQKDKITHKYLSMQLPDDIRNKYIDEEFEEWKNQFSLATGICDYFVKAYPANRQYQHGRHYLAARAFEKIQINYIDTASGITLGQAMCFVYKAMHDDRVFKTAQDKALIKRSFINHLLEIEIEYRSQGYERDTCDSGVFNKIISVLDRQHPLVKLDHFSGRFIQLYIKDLGEELYSSQSIANKKLILNHIRNVMKKNVSNNNDDNDMQVNSEPDLPEFFTQALRDIFQKRYQENIKHNDIAPLVLAGWMNNLSFSLFPKINFEYDLTVHLENIWSKLNKEERMRVIESITQEGLLPNAFIQHFLPMMPSINNYLPEAVKDFLRFPISLELTPSIESDYMENKKAIKNESNSAINLQATVSMKNLFSTNNIVSKNETNNIIKPSSPRR